MRRATIFLVGTLLSLTACEGLREEEPQELAVTASANPKPRVGKLIKTPNALPGRYIVVLEDTAAPRGLVDTLAGEMAQAHRASVKHVFHHALRGFAVSMPEAAAHALSADPRVRYVEEDVEVRLSATQGSATWGVDRIDQRDLPLNTLYTYEATGKGVNAYILDTGIRITHAEFGGRAFSGFDAVQDGNGTNDCHGHGTHVAGTVGGATWGVAKEVKLHAVRVLGCDGAAPASVIIAGVDWVTAHHMKPAVANMSLGIDIITQSLDDAVTASVQAGVVYTLSAGNNTADACYASPARTPLAITVGATTRTDARSSFSNYGLCLDLFAPGSDITSAWYTSDTASQILSGTSMAAPHVAGAAALYLEKDPTATPERVTDELIERATKGKVTGPGSLSPNRLLFSGCPVPGDTTPPQVALTAPVAGGTLIGTVTLRAEATDDTGIKRVEFFVDGRLIGTDAYPPFEVAWDSTGAGNGSSVLTAKAYGMGCQLAFSAGVPVTLANPGNATFDVALGTPVCAAVDRQCDTAGLVAGRGSLGPELHAPNTLQGACADGSSGSALSGPSLQRLKVATTGGTLLAGGKQVRVEATVSASASYASEKLDLYHAPDANNPNWTLLGTFSPNRRGTNVLGRNFILPPGNLQVLRGVYRMGGSPNPCAPSSLHDHDDLVFAVGTETDTQPPTVAFSGMFEGMRVYETFYPSFTLHDDFLVTRVDLFAGDTQVGSSPEPFFTILWDTRSVPNGPLTLRARAWDSSGLSSFSEPVNVVVDNDYTPPTVSLTSPAEGASVEGTITLRASATDNWVLTKVEFYVDGILKVTDTSSPYSASWNPRLVGNGSHTLTAKAYDRAYNVGSSSPVTVIVNNDIAAPVVSITSPSNGAMVQGVLTLEASATDDRAVTRVEFFSGTTRLGSDTTAPFSIPWDTSALPNTGYTLTAKAYDAAGNVGTSSPITVTLSNSDSATEGPAPKAAGVEPSARRE
ncbi:Ig-like domain-containing protein [Hyalangium rubrum]|uniref:Ig-like domain-containing protein n=1 Tax=Hyalangium rubrum TaxID=3103134 RepID=A0ABU5HIZ4_9BACT|nr:Ig-like domain-containing protein [Hyalangium sp. s54d21]MDY7232813.1 Ig-like domain-containing protein [Hyalangium sp. s54d21]